MRTSGVKLVAEVEAYKGGMDQAAKSTDGLKRSIDGVGQSSTTTGRKVDDLGGDFRDTAQDARTLKAEIEQAEQALNGLAAEFAATSSASDRLDLTRAMRKQQGELRQLLKVQNLLPKPDEVDPVARGFGARLIGAVGKGLEAAPLSPHMMAAAGVAAVAAAPLIASTFSAAVVGGAGIGGMAGGLLLAARDTQVKAAAAALGDSVMTDLNRRAGGFVGPMIDSIGKVRTAWGALGPDLDRIFASSRFVEPLTAGGIAGGRALIGGIADAVEKADPVIQSISDAFGRIGSATGDVFSQLADDADEGASALNDLSMAMSNLITVTGGIVHAAASVKGWTDQLDVGIDKARYWLEANAGFTGQMDLTADGFARGTKEAQAFERLATGVGTAMDVTTLRLAGVTDAQIRQSDASGKAVEAADKLKGATQGAAGAAGVLGVEVEQTGKKVEIAKQKFVALEEILQRTADRNISAAEATIQLRESTKAAADAADSKKKVTDAEASALIRLARDTNTSTKALDEQGRTTGEATKAHETNRKKLIEVAEKMGYTKGEAKKLANQYLATPKGVTTSIDQPGMKKSRDETKKYHEQLDKITRKIKTEVSVKGDAEAYRKLEKLLVAQQAAQRGISISAAQSAYNKQEAKAFDGGGWTGPGSKYQPAGIVHADEFVVRKESRQKIERQHPGLLDELNATGQIPGHAAGGLVMPFRVNASLTKIISMADALSKVTPSFGNWPSSPSAQRGDSGVWRSIVAMIRATGPMSGQFGNAYRPGDPKWHGSGRAVDWMGFNQDRLARFLAAKRPLELIHRTNSRDYAYTRGRNMGSFNNALMQAHRNHIHIAMGDGGIINEHVFGVGASGRTYEFGERGRPEAVTPLTPQYQAARAGGGMVVNNNINVTVTAPVGSHPREIGRQVLEVVGKHLESGGELRVNGKLILSGT